MDCYLKMNWNGEIKILLINKWRKYVLIMMGLGTSCHYIYVLHKAIQIEHKNMEHV